MRSDKIFDAVTGGMFRRNASLWEICALTAVIGGVLACPFIYAAGVNQRNYKNELKELDNSATIVFNSIADCVNKGSDAASCRASRDRAMDIAGDIGTDLNYGSEASCKRAHGTCSEEYEAAGGFSTYHPLMIGWQAARDNLRKAVPLYASPFQGEAIRWDGRTFNMR